MRVRPFESLSFSVPKGKFLGISGPSGIGKSTILKCIYRTYLPSSGSILYESERFGELDLAQANERQIIALRRSEIGYVSQFLKVIPRVSAEQIVAQRAMAAGMSAEEAIERARSILKRLGIPQQLWRAFPATFSGGEQQRVNLARAFVVRPRLLILDEPTASLDPDSKKIVISILHEMKRAGTTMIGVFHDHKLMEKVADDILDLKAWTMYQPCQETALSNQ